MYLCDYCFSGDVCKFATQLDLGCSRVRDILTGANQISIKLLVQILAHMDVRADWLLYGSGPMVPGLLPALEEPAAFKLPPKIYSSFQVFDTASSSHNLSDQTPIPVDSSLDAEPTPPNGAHFSLATAIHAARSAGQPVLVCLGADAVQAGAGAVVAEMLRRSYVTGAALTGAGALCDVSAAKPALVPDFNYIARLAASQGLGYGEAVGRWAFSPRDSSARSLLYLSRLLECPVTIHAEIGETSNHLHASPRGAELGAAIGAVTYTDFLIFTEQIRQMLSGAGGVALFFGDVPRFLRLFLQALFAVQTTIENLATFNAGAVLHADNTSFCEEIRKYGGSPHVLHGAYRSNTLTLLNACDAVYSGKIPNEFKT